ncbi:histidinol-phosphate transaminase [Candidatus Gottesmanbacteria bacterium]|nr:histidinol-phosphate transaminase [Candidatus Gottesmanbacteria bacterium]
MKAKNLTSYIRSDIASMDPYIAPSSMADIQSRLNVDQENIIKLDSGECQFEMFPEIKTALKNLSNIRFYPDSVYKKLRSALSIYTKVPIESIVVGNGSDEVLDLLFRLFFNNDEAIINCPPTFGMYTSFARLNRIPIITVQRNLDFSLDMQEILNSINGRVKAIVVCTPNNPTGTVTSEKNIRTLLNTGILVIIDEAYMEFSKTDNSTLLKKYKNLVIVRTLSKWAGLAGLRLGYALMDPVLVKEYMKIKPPYNVNAAANACGISVLNNLTQTKKNIQYIVDERNRVFEKLKQIPYLTVFPSDSNSLYMQIKSNGKQLREFLDKKSIFVRFLDSFSAFRLSIGRKEQNDKVLQALKAFELPNSNILEEDIYILKSIPGFNNDWDLSYELIRLVSSGYKGNEFLINAKPLSNKKSKEYQFIKDVFQCFYLGNQVFKDIYKRNPPVSVSNGFINNEALLISEPLIKQLSKKNTLGIATSRPRYEALYTLRKLKLTPAIIPEENIVALEDVPREKPFPDPLLKVKTILKSTNPIYIGDSINDTIAAKNAGMPCIYIGKEKLGDFQIQNVDSISEVLI